MLLGLCFYTFTQGSIYLGLSLLPAVTVSIILSFTPIPVTFFGFIILSERPMIYQLLGVILFIVGIFAYFYPESYYWQIGIFIVVSAIILPMTRKLAKKITKDSPQTANVDALIGKIGVVVKTIDPDIAGQVQINGEVWRAISEEMIEENEKATVLKVAGTTLYVEKQ